MAGRGVVVCGVVALHRGALTSQGTKPMGQTQGPIDTPSLISAGPPWV